MRRNPRFARVAIQLMWAADGDPRLETLEPQDLGLTLGQGKHLMCLLFSPLDRIEEKIVAAIRPSGASS